MWKYLNCMMPLHPKYREIFTEENKREPCEKYLNMENLPIIQIRLFHEKVVLLQKIKNRI